MKNYLYILLGVILAIVSTYGENLILFIICFVASVFFISLGIYKELYINK